MDYNDYFALILYYGRTRFYHLMQKSALDGLSKFPMHSAFRLYNGISLSLGNRVQEGIRELNPLKNDHELGLAALYALKYSHLRCIVVDKEALINLETRIGECTPENPQTAYYAATFLYFSNQLTKAREFVDKALKLDNQYEPGILLKAWTDLALNKLSLSTSVLRVFEQAVSKGKNIDAALGQVRYFQLKGQFDNAINILNKISIRFPELSIPLIEKMDTQLAGYDWDHTLETSSRIINLEPTNIAALRVRTLIFLCREANFKESANNLQQLLTTTESVEKGNFDLLLKTCQLFSRISSRNKTILSITLRFVDKITQLNPGTIQFVTELGYQNLMIGNLDEAESCFRSATRINHNYFYALCGQVLCELLQNEQEKASQHIEILVELDSLKREKTSDMLFFIKAKISKHPDEAIPLLIKATELHLQALENQPFGIEYIRLLNPDFLLQVTDEFIRQSPFKTCLKIGHLNVETETIHITLKHSLSILEIILRACPSHSQAMFSRAKVEFFCGELSRAVLTLQNILNDESELSTDAHLLLAQIQIQQEQYLPALQTLEMLLSLNFAVRKMPLYHLLLGIVQSRQSDFVNAQNSFLNAMQLIGSPFLGISDRVSDKHKPSSTTAVGSFLLPDKVTLYLELVQVFLKIGESDGYYESERLIQCAIDEFSNTEEEGRIVIANADLMLRKCNITGAISLLSAIESGQSYYIQSKTHLAHIYLEHRKDRVAFAKCFRELVKACPEKESYLMLGEAYISIQEPDLAIEAYQTALNINPNDSSLAKKLGRAYVKTHQYSKAIKYYQAALKADSHCGLKLDLAELFLKLKQYQDAADILSDDLEDRKIEEQDISGLQQRSKQLMLLARVHEKSGNIAQSLQTLNKAKDNLYRIQKRISVDQSGCILEQHKIISKICLSMAQQSIVLRDNDQALKCYKECLKYNPNNVDVLSSLARLYMQMNLMELCRDVCVQILQIENNNEAASVIMADLSFRKMDFENAGYHFSQLLISQPCYWTALARLIEVMRRSGTLQDVVPFLQRAENSITNTKAAGLNFCKGLYEWYCGNPNGALRYFNTTRRDYEWGQQAIFNMIEICINPDGDIPIVGDIQDSVDSGDFSDSRLIALRTAERLLRELRPNTSGILNETLNHRLMQNFLQVASKQKFQVESALQDFTDIANKEEYQNMVGPLLGMASALVLLKQTQRAKNHLKRISRMAWNFEEAEYLERSWLLLADIYIHSNKLETAESFLDRVLEHNKSNTKAYELAGYIAEKSQNIRDATKHYQNAWICGGRSKSHIGYKLAYTYMKSKRYSNAIDICQQVIKMHPDYIVIRKDILEKCRANLRP